MLRQSESAFDIARISAGEKTKKVLGLLNPSFECRYDFGCVVHQLFCLPYLEHGCDAALLSQFDEPQRFLARGERALGDIEFEIKFAQTEVSGRHVADQRRHYHSLFFFSSSEVRSCCGCLLSQSSPDIELEREQVQQHAAKRTIAFDWLR